MLMRQYVYPANGGTFQPRVEAVVATVGLDGTVNEILPLTAHPEVVIHRLEQRRFGRAMNQRELIVIAWFSPGN